MTKFLREIFSEQLDSGASFGSFSRAASGVALLAVIAWVTRVVWRTDRVPDLTNPMCFVCGLYAIRRFPDIVGSLTSALAALRGGGTPKP